MYSLVNFSEETYATRALFLVAADVMADGVQQVGFAQAHAAVEEKRVVGLAGRLGDGLGGGVGKVVVVADHEGFEGVLGIERRVLAGGVRVGSSVPKSWTLCDSARGRTGAAASRHVGRWQL